MKHNSYRVVIIGAGPAGSACAIELARAGIGPVLLIEATAYETFRIGETIPPEANVVVRQLGILEAFLAEQHEPCYGSCSWWGDDRRGYNDTLLSPHGHGWHLDRQRFDAFLARQAAQVGTELLTETRFLDSQPIEGGGFHLALRLADGTSETVTAATVVDASGTRSVFALEQGSQKVDHDPLVCLGMRFSIAGASRSISKLTHLEATEYGWWYAARLPAEQLLVALYTDATIIKAHRFNQPERFQLAVAQTANLHQLVHGLAPVDPAPHGFPAPSYRLDKITGRDWLAIGDAACAYDPITSQGIMKSLTTGMQAAAAITDRTHGRGQHDFAQYDLEVSRRFDQYLEMRTHYYRMEMRWPEARFWRKYQNRLKGPTA